METNTARPSYQRWLRVATTPVLMGGVLFGAAGRLDWIAGWLFIGLVLLLQVYVIRMLVRVSPDLLTERERVRVGTKPWDKAIAPLIALVLPILMWLAAGFDVRAGRRFLSAGLQGIGFLLGIASGWLAARAMAENRFFSGTVRIQQERGHYVISTGPYSVVRHPGCVGMLGFTLATPLALGSRSALIPSCICVALLVIRTVLEDRMLRAELKGYADYAGRVRWRLIPGLW